MIKNSAQPQLGMEFWIQLERARRLVKNPNMDYRNLHTTNLFRDIMIIVLRRSDCQIFSLQHHYLLAQSYSNRIIIQ